MEEYHRRKRMIEGIQRDQVGDLGRGYVEMDVGRRRRGEDVPV